MLTWIFRTDLAFALGIGLFASGGDFMRGFHSFFSHQQAPLIIVACATLGLAMRVAELRYKEARMLRASGTVAPSDP